MNKAYFGKSSLGIVALGVLAGSLAVGCGGADSKAAGTADTPNNNNQQAMITETSAVPSGCGATLTFDITSAQNQNIQFIALDKSDLKDAQMTLQTVDDEGHVKSLNQTQQQADSSLQALINSFTSSTNAAQAHARTTLQNSAQRQTNATTDSMEQVQTSASNNSSLQTSEDLNTTHFANHEDSASAANSNSASNSASQFANSNLNASASNSASQAAQANALQMAQNSNFSLAKLNGMFTQTTITPMDDPTVSTIFSQLALNKANASNLSQSNSANSSNSVAAANQNVNQSAASANNAKSNSNSSSSSAHSFTDQTADTMHHATSTSSHNDVATNETRVLHTAIGTSDVASNSSDAIQDSSNSASATAAQKQEQSNIQRSSASTLVFNNLDQVQSLHFVLTVQISSSKSNALTQLFVGAFNTIVAQKQFPIALPACGGDR